MSIDEQLVRRTHTVWNLSISVRVPGNYRYAVLTATAQGVAGELRLVHMEMCDLPLSDQVLAEFETACFTALEDAVTRLVGIQPQLGLE